MNLYGVLGRYIPAFGRVVGRMQYDLFHAYTVDAHTLFVVSNLRRFAIPKFNHEFPALEPDHAVAAAPGARLSRRAVPRHRQGPRRRPFRARRGRCGGVLPGAGSRPLRGAPGRLAGQEPPDPVHHLAEEGHQRSGHHSRLRTPRRRSGASRLSLRAHGRGRARHQPQALEHLEGEAVRGILRAHQARACAAAWKPRSIRTS